MAPRKRDDYTLLMIGRGTERLAQELIMLCRTTCSHGATVVDLCGTLELAKVVPPDRTAASVLAILDKMIASSAPIISVCNCDQPDLALLVRYMDRLALLGTESDVQAASAACAGSRNTVDVF